MVADGDYKQAQILFAEFESQMKSLHFKYKMMKAIIMERNDEPWTEFLPLLEDAWLEIESDKKLSKTDKLYLKLYIWSMATRYKDYYNYTYKNIEYIEVMDVPLKQVSKSWKMDFPVRDHPDWDQYGA